MADHPEYHSAVTESARRMRVIVVHIGLIIVAVGSLLPWVTIGGRERSGPGLANASLGLADLGFETLLSGFGYGWYAIPIAGLIAWVSLWRQFPPAPDTATATFAAILLVAALFFGVVVIRGPFAGSHIGVVITLIGAAVAFVGCRYPLARPKQVT